MIYLLYQSPWPVGGSTSYTVHLKRVLGNNAEVIRLAKRTEDGVRQLSEFGVYYRNMAFEDVLRLRGPILLTASNPKMDENVWATLGKRRNVWATFHDPNEAKLYSHWKYFNLRRVICIRQTGRRYIPAAVFIPHPYFPFVHRVEHRTTNAVSIARTSSVKRADWIMHANRVLPFQYRVELHGEMNRMWYAYFIRKHFPEVNVDTKYPRTWGAGVELCARAHFMVDLTVFKGDGGGTQYTLLEAMNGGAVPIMSKDWCSYPGPARTFGPAVSSVDELVSTLKRRGSLPMGAQRRQNYEYLLREHGVEVIQKKYLHYLGA